MTEQTAAAKPFNSEGNTVLHATLRRRLAAMLYESLLLLGVLSLTFMVPHLLIGIFFSITAPGGLLLLHVALVLAGYFVWYWSHGGQTLAMQTWKLQLTTPSGVPPRLIFLILRYLLSWPSLLFYGAGIVWALFDREHQFLHDRIAGTCIRQLPASVQASAPPQN